MAWRIVLKPTQRDPALIDDAPLELPLAPDAGDAALYYGMASKFAADLEAARADLNRLRAKQTIEDVRAGMLEGYSNKVFNFVALYCFVVGVFLGLAAWKVHTGFELSDTILGIIAGSTAVSVIGLIGMVVSGLFGSTPRGRAKATAKKPTA